MNTLGIWENCVVLAGALHFAQPIAMRFVPQVLGWGEDLAKMRPINRQIFRVVVGGLMLLLFGLGLLVVSFPGWMLRVPLGLGLLALLAVHWAYRLAVQLKVYRQTWPSDRQTSYWALTLLLAFKTGLYALCLAVGLLAR